MIAGLHLCCERLDSCVFLWQFKVSQMKTSHTRLPRCAACSIVVLHILFNKVSVARCCYRLLYTIYIFGCTTVGWVISIIDLVSNSRHIYWLSCCWSRISFILRICVWLNPKALQKIFPSIQKSGWFGKALLLLLFSPSYRSGLLVLYWGRLAHINTSDGKRFLSNSFRVIRVTCGSLT